MGINYTPRTWADGEVVTPTEMNTEIRDGFSGMQAAWSSYTPTFLAGGSATNVGTGVLQGRYMRWGKTVFFSVYVLIGNGFSFPSGIWTFAVPFARAYSNQAVGQCWALSSPTHKTGGSWIEGADTVHGYIDTAQLDVNTPFTWAVGDSLYLFGFYEAA